MVQALVRFQCLLLKILAKAGNQIQINISFKHSKTKIMNPNTKEMLDTLDMILEIKTQREADLMALLIEVQYKGRMFYTLLNRELKDKIEFINNQNNL
jgi:hypothetical protein